MIPAYLVRDIASFKSPGRINLQKSSEGELLWLWPSFFFSLTCCTIVQFASMKWQFIGTIIVQLRMQAKHLLHSTFLRQEVPHCWHATCTLRTGNENSSGVLSKDPHVCWRSSPALCVCSTADAWVAFQVTFFFLPGCCCDVFPTPPNETGTYKCSFTCLHQGPAL